ncbi:MAG: hypothetical protein N2578_05230 [Bdellovibrionaceae bacterium]|nr:hypothetical protein [Pseudobdellovibrionaceae bacterium]
MDALTHIRSGDRLFVHGGAATPGVLLKALVERAHELNDVEILHLHTEGPAVYARPEFSGHFRVANFFVGANMRGLLDMERVDYLPCFLSEIPTLIRSGKRKINVALISVSPPDKHGYCSLGTSVDVARAAVETAELVIAQINPRMPRVHGDGIIHKSMIHYGVAVEEELPEVKPRAQTEVEKAIGRNVAELIEDGSCLQMGIGAIPDAVLSALTNHKDLGIHTEMWSDGVLKLIESGVVNNKKKKVHRGKTVGSFVIGTRRLFDFMDDNAAVLLLESAYVNSPAVISRNPKVVAINSAVEIDLTGQVCADSIGHHVISGVGGQVDFIRGAALSEGGKPIIALPATTHQGISRIVPSLRAGAGVVTTRAHVHYVVTEYGIADLYGKTLSERAKSLIQIAHPDHREILEREWYCQYVSAKRN